MALVITVAENDYFTVGGTKCYLRSMRSPNNFKLEVDRGWATELFQITDTQRVEIMPSVFVSAGHERFVGDGEQKQVTVAIEAPRDLKILRRKVVEHDKSLPL